jgi:hypothetical protein
MVLKIGFIVTPAICRMADQWPSMKSGGKASET